MKRAVQLTISLAITGVCLWWTFRDTNWPEMWASLRTANYLWLVPYVGILTLIHLCRTVRWGAFLTGIEKVPFKPLNEASGIGFMMLIILPFRLGEFARPFLIAQRSGIRRSAAMTSVVLERIVDGIIIAVLLRTLVFFIPEGQGELRHIVWGANAMFAVFFGGLTFLIFSVWQQSRAVALVRATAGRVSPALGEKLAGIVDSFVGAVRQLPGPKYMLIFIAGTAGYWALNGAGMAMVARAFDCTSGGVAVCQPMSLTLFQGYVVLSVLVVGMMIPAAPGSAGTFQAAILIGLAVFLPDSVVRSSGVAYANVLWLTQIAQQVIFGMILMVLSRQSFRELAGKLNEEGKSAGLEASSRGA